MMVVVMMMRGSSECRGCADRKEQRQNNDFLHGRIVARAGAVDCAGHEGGALIVKELQEAVGSKGQKRMALFPTGFCVETSSRCKNYTIAAACLSLAAQDLMVR